ncbi:conserved hypothetical protein [Perkinsus marinus ATCC 50983]|uniref:RRM domain-containing protein n=1 Tax=Perkinsus marinus (strain ATCC 50983 / TXsc) TaxID=423536 RepID=C5LNQ2_PERM5|nr:conserved hypothetical protein [Perkinsus marinus ATCC 50983]EER01671.1 conserved hypothetical protein [Perkinsus marinus ATCC 50983]|eukprot:XP_002768953.1 conserved hypothetical protein [Perkinsus marinus ATCC 50983]
MSTHRGRRPPTIQEEPLGGGDPSSDSSRGVSYAANEKIPRDLQTAREAYALGDSELSRLAHQTRELAEIASGETSQLVSVGDDDVIKAQALSGLIGGSLATSLLVSAFGGFTVGIARNTVLMLFILSLICAAVVASNQLWIKEKAGLEYSDYERARELWEVDNFPEGEVQEMIYIYRNAGLSNEDSKTVAHILSKLDQQTKLRTARYCTALASFVILAGFLPCVLIIRGYNALVIWLFSEAQMIGALMTRSRNRVEKGQMQKTQRADVSKDNLHRAFRRFGDIREVYVPTDPATGQGRGFGFVEYQRQDSAEQAMLEMNNKQFESSVIQLVFVEPKDQHDRYKEEKLKGNAFADQFIANNLVKATSKAHINNSRHLPLPLVIFEPLDPDDLAAAQMRQYLSAIVRLDVIALAPRPSGTAVHAAAVEGSLAELAQLMKACVKADVDIRLILQEAHGRILRLTEEFTQMYAE